MGILEPGNEGSRENRRGWAAMCRENRSGWVCRAALCCWNRKAAEVSAVWAAPRGARCHTHTTASSKCSWIMTQNESPLTLGCCRAAGHVLICWWARRREVLPTHAMPFQMLVAIESSSVQGLASWPSFLQAAEKIEMAAPSCCRPGSCAESLPQQVRET